MSKFNDFYSRINEDEAIKAEIGAVLGGNSFENATDEQLKNIGEIAKKAGFDFALDEVKEFFACGELDDDDLDAVAGGKGETYYIDQYLYVCNQGGQAGVDDGNFGDGAERVRRLVE